jgi:hypothetical protein
MPQSNPKRRGTYNQLLDKDSLSDTGTTKETNLSTTSVGGKKIDDLDTSNQDLGGGGLFSEAGGFGVDRSELGSLDGTTLVNGVTSDVHDTTERTRTDGDTDGGASVRAGSTTGKTLGTWIMLVMKTRLG